MQRIQIALVFHVAGRRNDMSSADDSALYQEARMLSAQAFSDFAASEMPLKFPASMRELYAHAIKQLSGYGEEHPIHLIIYFCHYLDLPRCLPRTTCDAICHADVYKTHLGASSIVRLQACAEQCLMATGDRIMDKQSYQGDTFSASSQNIQICLQNIQQGIQQWQQNLPSQNTQLLKAGIIANLH